MPNDDSAQRDPNLVKSILHAGQVLSSFRFPGELLWAYCATVGQNASPGGALRIVDHFYANDLLLTGSRA